MVNRVVGFTTLLLLCGFLFMATIVEGHTPVVLVPGLTGSKLMAHSDSNYTTPYYWCNWGAGATWLLWIEEQSILPYVADCTLYNMMLQNRNGEMDNRPGLNVYREGKPGDVWETVVMGPKNQSDFGLMVQELITSGYRVGKDLFGSSYRWRHGPRAWAQPGQDWDQLVDVIEMAYTAGGNQPVILLTISMGAPYLNLFLQVHVTQAWKDKYILRLVTTSGVFGGSSSGLIEVTSGNSWGIEWITAAQFRDLARSWPSVFFLLPPASVFGNDTVFVRASGKEYTALDYGQMMRDMGATGPNDTPADYIDALATQTDWQLDGPGVPVTCMYGANLPTPYSLTFTVPPSLMGGVQPSDIQFLPGDGTVVSKALEMCSNWRSNAGKPVVSMAFPGADHDSFFTNSTLVNIVVDYILSHQN